MPSRKFQEYMAAGGFMGDPDTMPIPTGPDAGVPTMPPDWTPPEPNIPRGCTGGVVTVGGVKGFQLTRPGVREKTAMMYLHGGGFTIGSAMMADDIMLHFVEADNIECYGVEYTLAPRAVFPTQINEAVSFYKGLLDMGYEKIIIGGESAGASLTLSVTLALRDQGLPLPRAIWCSSPPGYALAEPEEVYKQDMFFDMRRSIYDVYSPGADPKDPLLSPVYADYTGMPPMLLQASGEESLCSGSVEIARAAAKADCEVLLHVYKDMGHTLAVMFGEYPEADFAMAEIDSFIKFWLDLE